VPLTLDTMDRMTDPSAPARPRPALRERLGANHLVRGSLALLLGSVGAAFAGYFYWTYLSRRFGAEVVGEISALGAVAAVVSLLHSHSVGASILTRLHTLDPGSRRALIRVSLLVVGTCAALTGAVGAVALLLLDATPTLRNPVFFVMFVLGVSTQSVGATLDSAALALRSSRTSALRNTVSSAVRIPLLLLLVVAAGSLGGVAVALTTATIVSTLSALWLVRALHHLTGHAESAVPLRSVVGELRRGAWPQMLVALGGGMPAQVLPALVVALAGASAGGHFSIAWLVGSTCFMVPPMVCSALLAEGARDIETLGHRVRHAVVLISILLVGPVFAYLFAGDRILELFGEGFAVGGHGVLAVLAVSALPNTVFNVSVSVLRTHELLRTAAKVSVIAGVVTLTFALALVPFAGAAGAAAGWLVGQLVGACVGALACRRCLPRQV
jgi:O-antigen/teichoic acid export membrane protein